MPACPVERAGDPRAVTVEIGDCPVQRVDRICRRPIARIRSFEGVSRSIERQKAALRLLESPGVSLVELQQAFLAAPLYSRDAKSPTVYTAVYRPAASKVDYLWPGHVMTQRMGSFAPGAYMHDYGDLRALT